MVFNTRVSRRSIVASSLTVAGATALLSRVNAKPARLNAVQDATSPVSIEYWYSEGSTIGSSLPALVERFELAHPNWSVEPRSYVVYPEVVQALQAALAAGQPPAVAQIGYDYLRYVSDNMPYLPISEAAARDPGGAAFLEAFSPTVLALGQVDGAQQGLPFVVAGTYLVYNADLFAAAGIERAPRTWTELRDNARQLTATTGVSALSISDSGDFWNLQALLESNGAKLLIEDNGVFRTGVSQAEAIEAMQLYADMVLVDQTATPSGWGDGIPLFNSGQVAMFLGGGSIVIGAELNGDFAVETALFPTFGDKPRRIPVGGNSHFIFATDQAQQAAAWAFLRFLNTPESVTYWIEKTGFMPPVDGLIDDPRYLKPFFDETPHLRIELEQMPDLTPWVSWPGTNGLAAYRALSDAREKILTGEQTVASAFSEAATLIDELINT